MIRRMTTFQKIPHPGRGTRPPARGPRPLEPGVLPVFRAFIWLRFGFTLFPVLLGLFLYMLGVFNPADVRLPAVSGNKLILQVRLSEILAPGLLLLYLYWPRLPEKLGRLFLPLAILIAALEPIINQNLFLAFAKEWVLNSENVGSAWSLLPILFAPLVLVAWQYNLRTVLLFVFGTTLLDFLLLTWATGMVDAALLPLYSALVTRTAAMLIAGYLVVQLMKTQRAQQAALQKANADLQGYLAAQEQLTISRERNRLARELHDTLAHTLSMLAVQLEAARSVWVDEPDEARGLLDQSLTATRAGLTETRRALQALRASPLEDLGLGLALRTLAGEVAERADLNLETNIPDPLPTLTPLIEQTIYRTAQEALANITQHAGAQNAALTLALHNAALTLTITDDGRGFDPAAREESAHFGLKGLRERAKMAGGVLEVVSASGEGVRVELRVGV